ncbi:MAG: hypothetical protein J6U92_05250 [Clostridia bacterium]|nr:hypothetical protein [Clostridia bacterium]
MLDKIKHYAIPAKCKVCKPVDCPAENIDLSGLMPKAWEVRYDELKVEYGTVLRNDVTGAFTPQGACSDGRYIYRALVQDNNASTKLQKIDMYSGKILLEKENTSYTHANDMTYCSKDGYIYIAHANVTSWCSKVDRNTLEEVERFDIGGDTWGISYNAHDNVFVVGVTGATYLSVYSYDWKFIYRIKMNNNYSTLVKQGIWCNQFYIFCGLDNRYGTVAGNQYGSRIMVYTWTGDFIKSIYLDIAELEWLHVQCDTLNGNFASRGTLYVGTYEGRDENDIKSGRIITYKFDLYPSQTDPAGRTSDTSGGLNRIHRCQEGTHVKLFEGNAGNGTFSLNLLPNTDVGSFRYLVFWVYGSNYKTIQMLRTGTTYVLREHNLGNDTNDTDIYMRELQLELGADERSFTIVHNLCQRIKFNEDGTHYVHKEVDSFNLYTPIYIREIWGVV